MGRGLTKAVVEEAALVAFAGGDPQHYLACRDPQERKLLAAVAQRHSELLVQRDDNLAIRIANAVWQGSPFK